MDNSNVVGTRPWLPWPLSRWRIFTTAVPAERLAALRIALAIVLLLDLLTTYAPNVDNFFGPDSLCRVADEDLFAYVIAGGAKPSWYWSLFRGFGHPVNLAFALLLWLGLSVALAGVVCRSDHESDQAGGHGGLLALWTATLILTVLGFWARARSLPDTVESAVEGPLQVAAAAVAWLVSGALLLAAIRRWGRRFDRNSPVLGLTVAFVLTSGLLVVGAWQCLHDLLDVGLPLDLDWLLEPWDTKRFALRLGLGVWGLSVLFLLLGLWTRASAVVAWVLMISFDGLNHYVIDSGETVRSILLFYLMLTPCAAVWSLDARRLQRDAARYVHPWVFRLLFLQLICMYFFNGVYKLFGDEWQEGSSLYYVLSSPRLARTSALKLPYAVLQAASYAVLAFELTFPLLILWRWTRIPALVLGALFHLGIFVGMEIGYFGLYMLCMYVPLVPWERLRRWRRRQER